MHRRARVCSCSAGCRRLPAIFARAELAACGIAARKNLRTGVERRGERRVESDCWGIGAAMIISMPSIANLMTMVICFHGYRRLAECRGSRARPRPGQRAAKIDIDWVLPTLQRTRSWRVSLRALSFPVVAGTFHARYRTVAASPFGR